MKGKLMDVLIMFFFLFFNLKDKVYKSFELSSITYAIKPF